MSETRDIGRTVRRTALGVVGMFAFAFALVPLYDVICDVTGLNGKTGDAYEYAEADLEADRSRLIAIRFVTNNNAGMPWGFGANKGGMRVNPGGINEAVFHAHNPTDRIMVAQTIPSVAPGRAATFFHKTQCFCFDQQVLMPGEAVEMPVRFIVDRDLPRTVDAITLSYTMFDITDQASGRAALAEYTARNAVETEAVDVAPAATLADGETTGH
jgi:cytochrome c oxidase assembly protein subunit 11